MRTTVRVIQGQLAEVEPEVIAFANEQLRTITVGQSRTFSEAFLRLWRAERVGRTSTAAT